MNYRQSHTKCLSSTLVAVVLLALSGCSDKGTTTEESSVPNFALKFSGVNSYVEIPWSQVLKPHTFTIELWVFVDTLHSNSIPLLSATGVNEWNSADGYSLKFELGKLHFRVAKASNLAETFWADYVPQTKKWIHLAGVYNETEGIVYIDGEEAARYDRPFTVSYGMQGMTLGAGLNTLFGGTLFFRGMLDEVRVWNYARSEQQIQQAKNIRLEGNEDGLVGYWNFDGNELANVVPDASQYNNHGTIWGDTYLVSNTPF